MKVVEVQWSDAASYHESWTYKKARKEGGLVKCKTVGYLFEETPEHYCLVQTLDESETLDTLMYIPKTWVVKYNELGPRHS